MSERIENRASFDLIRYSQVWEDADILLEALDLQSNDVALSIASAGDNAFAMLAQAPRAVYAIDLSFPQIACCELRKAMYRQLSHRDHLLFGGVVAGEMDRASVFATLELPSSVEEYWQHNKDLIHQGFMQTGKFERYFGLFRNRVLPLIHNRRRISQLIEPKTTEQRLEFYDKKWDNLRWKIMFRLFFSRFAMGRLGRDKEFFAYVEGSVADRILGRAKHALTHLDTAENPYLHYILNGIYDTALPYSLRPENYDKIRDNLDKISFQQVSIQEFLSGHKGEITAFNLSDIFEYMTQQDTDELFRLMLEKTPSGSRFAYWNMLAPRQCGEDVRKQYNLTTNKATNTDLLNRDKAFFYSKFYLDKVN